MDKINILEFITESGIDIKVKYSSDTKYKMKRATDGSTGFDIYSPIDVVIKPQERNIIKTGIQVSFPKFVDMQIRPRSGLTSKGIYVWLGTVDSDYRGDIGIMLFNSTNDNFMIKDGDRIAQAVFSLHLNIKINEIEELDDTIRGKGGFGSTGR